ncbi:uncharacterized protein [Arachis hypogaea]|uniref:uncharacterized protein n=1 Tax=Arachis hypogaea TaxID=3818 RepID=UPI003B2114B5
MAVYFPKENFWDAKASRNASWVWKGILQGRELLRKQGKWCIGDGTHVSIRKDNWIAGRKKELNLGIADDRKVNELLNESGEWDKTKIYSMFSQEIADSIIRTPISTIKRHDTLYWPWREDGTYTIKTGYQAVRLEAQEKTKNGPSISTDRRGLWNEIWNMTVPPKIRTLITREKGAGSVQETNFKANRLRIGKHCIIKITNSEERKRKLPCLCTLGIGASVRAQAAEETQLKVSVTITYQHRFRREQQQSNDFNIPIA